MNCYTYLLEKYGSRIKEHSMEVQLTNTSGRYALPEDNLLLNKTIIGIYAWDLSTTAPDTGRTLINKAARNDAYVTLKSNNITILDQSPYSSFTLDDEWKEPKLVMIPSLTPSKSFIEISDTTLIAVGESILLNFIYLD